MVEFGDTIQLQNSLITGYQFNASWMISCFKKEFKHMINNKYPRVSVVTEEHFHTCEPTSRHQYRKALHQQDTSVHSWRPDGMCLAVKESWLGISQDLATSAPRLPSPPQDFWSWQWKKAHWLILTSLWKINSPNNGFLSWICSRLILFDVLLRAYF